MTGRAAGDDLPEAIELPGATKKSVRIAETTNVLRSGYQSPISETG